MEGFKAWSGTGQQQTSLKFSTWQKHNIVIKELLPLVILQAENHLQTISGGTAGGHRDQERAMRKRSVFVEQT